MNNLLAIGTRIIFTKTLTKPACEDSPACIYARKGDGGEIVSHGCREGYWVKWDAWPHKFGASADEFTVANPIAYGLDSCLENNKICQCCDRGDEYNGFSSGPISFTCPAHCVCHD